LHLDIKSHEGVNWINVANGRIQWWYVDSASNSTEYQEYFLWVKAVGA